MQLAETRGPRNGSRVHDPEMQYADAEEEEDDEAMGSSGEHTVSVF